MLVVLDVQYMFDSVAEELTKYILIFYYCAYISTWL